MESEMKCPRCSRVFRSKGGFKHHLDKIDCLKQGRECKPIEGDQIGFQAVKKTIPPSSQLLNMKVELPVPLQPQAPIPQAQPQPQPQPPSTNVLPSTTIPQISTDPTPRHITNIIPPKSLQTRSVQKMQS